MLENYFHLSLPLIDGFFRILRDEVPSNGIRENLTSLELNNALNALH